jgi:hypothetical protein
MADDDPSGGDVVKEWPLEGHFVIGGSWGLQVSIDCLGCTFRSRTASHDVEIGLTQLDTEEDSIPEALKGLLGGPPVPIMELTP